MNKPMTNSVHSPMMTKTLIAPFKNAVPLDSVLTEAIGEKRQRPASAALDNVTSSETRTEETKEREIIPFPVWGRIARIAAVFAILLSGVYLAIPHGDLRWSETQFVLLEETRSIEPTRPGESNLDQSSIESACQELHKFIDTAYENVVDEKRRKWDLRFTVEEHAKRGCV